MARDLAYSLRGLWPGSQTPPIPSHMLLGLGWALLPPLDQWRNQGTNQVIAVPHTRLINVTQVPEARHIDSKGSVRKNIQTALHSTPGETCQPESIDFKTGFLPHAYHSKLGDLVSHSSKGGDPEPPNACALWDKIELSHRW